MKTKPNQITRLKKLNIPGNAKSKIYIPAFSETEKQNIIAYHTFNKKVIGVYSEAARNELKSHPTWGPIISNMPKETIEARNKISIKLQGDAFLHNKWQPYIQDLTEQGKMYANMGIAFQDWFKVVAIVRTHLIPLIKKEFDRMPEKLVSIIQGLDLTLDLAMTVIGESYINEAKKIAEIQKFTVLEQKQASQYARSLIEASLDPLVTISASGKITDVNEASVKVTGVSRNLLIGTDFSNYFTEPVKAREGYKQVFDKGFVADYPLTIKHKKGKLTEVLYNASVYKDDKGKVLGVFAAARDITKQKDVEKQIQKIQTYTRMLIETSLDPQITKGPDGLITDVNEATVLITGISREKIIGTHFPNFFTEPLRAEKAYQEAFLKGEVRNIPLAIKHVSGKVTDVLYNATVYKDEFGKIQGVFASARDITDRIKAEDETKRTQTYTRSLIEASLDPLVTISADGKITDVNEASAKVTGLTRDHLIGTDFSNYFTEPIKAREGYQQVFDKGFVEDYPLTIKHASGKLTDVLYNASVYKDIKGNVLGVFAAARDITAQKKLAQREIEEREKELARIEELERFRKLTVGRELKMIELKKEIEQLKRKIT